MKLPNGNLAVIEIAKIRDYCLSASHPRGKHKARVFLAALGITAIHAEELRERLAEAARKDVAVLGTSDPYGTRYIIDFEMTFNERRADIRSCWIVKTREIEPRFVTCYIL